MCMSDKLLFFLITVIVVSIIDGMFILPIKRIDMNLYEKAKKAAAIISVPLILYSLYILLS